MENRVNNDALNYSQFTQDKILADKERELSQKAGRSNPKASLDKDAFMKLLLTELKYQDPTDPMDSSKMLEQTSQLAALETQENTNKMMKELASQLKDYANLNALGALGTIAKTGSDSILKIDNNDIKIKVFVPEFAVKGSYEIYDTTGEKLITSIGFGNAPAGIHEIIWDGKNNDGKEVENGNYIIKIKYENQDGQKGIATMGDYPIESVKFVDGKAMVKVAGEFVEIDKIREFYRI